MIMCTNNEEKFKTNYYDKLSCEESEEEKEIILNDSICIGKPLQLLIHTITKLLKH